MKNYMLILLIMSFHSIAAQKKEMKLETSFGGSLFFGGYNAPKELVLNQKIPAFSITIHAKQTVVIPLKKQFFLVTGLGVAGGASGLRNGNSLLESIEFMPNIDYSPTKKDSISTIIRASYNNLYLTVPLSIRYILHQRPRGSIAIEIGMENEFLIRSTTAVYFKSGNFNLYNYTLEYITREEGPIVDFYTAKVNKYAANVFGKLVLTHQINNKFAISWNLIYQKGVVRRNQLLKGINGFSSSFTLQYTFT